MGFLYPRTIDVKRPGAQTGEGQLGYGGATQAAETTIATGLPANLELRREGQRNTTGLPGTGTRPNYDVRIPRKACAKGTIKKLDIIVDDEGDRYQVLSPYWNSLGYALRVEILEA